LLCNQSVIFLHERLRYRNYKFVASQSSEGKELVEKYNLGSISKKSVVLLSGENVFSKSDAMLKVIDDLPHIWSIFKIFNFVPRKTRDRMYDLISKYRYLIAKK